MMDAFLDWNVLGGSKKTIILYFMNYYSSKISDYLIIVYWGFFVNSLLQSGNCRYSSRPWQKYHSC